MRHLLKVWQLMLCVVWLSVPARGSWEQTLEHIKALQAENKSVAVLVIDMQTSFARRWVPSEQSTVTSNIIELLDNLTPSESLRFIDIRFRGWGETLANITSALKRDTMLRTFAKGAEDAFTHQPPAAVAPEGASPGEVIKGQLGDFLREKGVTDIVSIGCYDGFCVSSTAKGGASEGFDVHVDPDLNIMNMYIKGYQEEEYREDIRENIKNWHELVQENPRIHLINKEPDICSHL